MTGRLIRLLLFVTSMGVLSGAAPPQYDHGVSLPTTWPLILGHRGACGMLPENTLPAYQLAIDQGADALETDIGLTRDLVPICLHDSYLSQTTDVADKFPDRKKTYYILDSQSIVTDYFSIDFTLEELKTLRAKQRYNARNKLYDGLYEIPTLAEYMTLVKEASRTVGLYIEMKNPDWLNSLDIVKEANTTFERIVLNVIESFGYKHETDPCFIQSFTLNSLYRFRNLTSLPLSSLNGASLSDELLDELAGFCYGIGVAKDLLVQIYSENNTIAGVTDLVSRAHSRGLRINVYTLRNEYNYLAFDYGLDPAIEYELFLETGVDGIFTDFPHTMYRVLNATYAECDCETNLGHALLPNIVVGILLQVVIEYNAILNF